MGDRAGGERPWEEAGREEAGVGTPRATRAERRDSAAAVAARERIP